MAIGAESTIDSNDPGGVTSPLMPVPFLLFVSGWQIALTKITKSMGSGVHLRGAPCCTCPMVLFGESIEMMKNQADALMIPVRCWCSGFGSQAQPVPHPKADGGPSYFALLCPAAAGRQLRSGRLGNRICFFFGGVCFVCLFVCLLTVCSFVCLVVWLSVWLFVCWLVGLLVGWLVCSFVGFFVCLFVRVCVCLFACLLACVPACLPACLPVCFGVQLRRGEGRTSRKGRLKSMVGEVTCLCVCVYVCGWVVGWVAGWLGGWVAGWVHGCMGAWVHGCMGAWVHGCMGGRVAGWVHGRMGGRVGGWVGVGRPGCSQPIPTSIRGEWLGP